MKVLKTDTVRLGNEFPCHTDNIVRTEMVGNSRERLRIWYVENNNQK